MNVGQAIRQATERLSATSGSARLDAELLMAHSLECSRSELLLNRMGERAPVRFQELVARRAAHEPVAYITGTCEFYGREFRVNDAVLIPRPDSESVIEAALSAVGDLEEGYLLDLGTGSGALLLTLLAERPGWRGYGLERSEGALRVARENAERLDLCERATFVPGDWTRGHGPGDDWLGGMNIPKVDLVIANPPYVEAGADLASDVRDFEPHEALFAGDDGLDDYRIIIPSLQQMMRVGANAVLEIGATQACAVTELAENAGFAVELRHDLANRPRALILS